MKKGNYPSTMKEGESFPFFILIIRFMPVARFSLLDVSGASAGSV